MAIDVTPSSERPRPASRRRRKRVLQCLIDLPHVVQVQAVQQRRIDLFHVPAIALGEHHPLDSRPLGRQVTMHESLKMQFRAEALNAFNTPYFERPNTSFGSSNFGRITSQEGFPRLIQLGLRLSF